MDPELLKELGLDGGEGNGGGQPSDDVDGSRDEEKKDLAARVEEKAKEMAKDVVPPPGLLRRSRSRSRSRFDHRLSIE